MATQRFSRDKPESKNIKTDCDKGEGKWIDELNQSVLEELAEAANSFLKQNSRFPCAFRGKRPHLVSGTFFLVVVVNVKNTLLSKTQFNLLILDYCNDNVY